MWNVNTNGNYNNNNASNSNGIRPALMESEISNPSDGTNTVHHHQRESYHDLWKCCTHEIKDGKIHFYMACFDY